MAVGRPQTGLPAAACKQENTGESQGPLHILRLAAPLRFRQLAGVTPGPYRRLMRYSALLAAALLLAACGQKAGQGPASNETAAAAGESETKGAHRDNKGKSAPEAIFTDAGGKAARISDFKGRPVLLNLWASWCAPCVKELPTLDKLAQSGRVQVLAVSQDTGPNASVVAFLEAHHIATLKPYQDDKMALSGALGPETVLPTSVLIDASGKEVWRYVGDLDWTSPEAAKLLAEAGPVTRG